MTSPKPIEVTDSMRCAGFESDAWNALSDAVIEAGGKWPYSCRESAQCVEAIFLAMYEEMCREHAEILKGIFG